MVAEKRWIEMSIKYKYRAVHDDDDGPVYAMYIGKNLSINVERR